MWINKLTHWKILEQSLRSYTKIINWKNIVGILIWLTLPFQGYLWSLVITDDTTGSRCNLQHLKVESNQLYLITILHKLYFWFFFFFLIKVFVFKYPNWDNWNKLLWKRLGMMKTQWRHRGDLFCFLLLKNLLILLLRRHCGLAHRVHPFIYNLYIKANISWIHDLPTV